MASKRKKVEPPQEEGAPAWMNTYGDMVTLVLTFFVLLFSFSTIDAKKWEAIVSSFTGTRIVAIAPLDPGEAPPFTEDIERTDDPKETTIPAANVAEQQKHFDELYKKIKSHISENQLDTQLNVTKDDNVIILRITDSALFDSGKDVIKEYARVLLLDVAKILEVYNDAIRKITVEGHTDNIPISSSRFRSNWDLSMSRAGSVLEFVSDVVKIDSSKFFVGGYGEFHPIASNDTKEGQAKNRRVDFVIESITKID